MYVPSLCTPPSVRISIIDPQQGKNKNKNAKKGNKVLDSSEKGIIISLEGSEKGIVEKKGDQNVTEFGSRDSQKQH